MIEIKQKIRTKYRGQNFTIEPGKYKKLPVQLQNDDDLMHYVKSVYPKGHKLAGKPSYIEGFVPSEEAEKKYKPLTKAGVKAGLSRITPDGVKKQGAPELKGSKNKV